MTFRHQKRLQKPIKLMVHCLSAVVSLTVADMHPDVFDHFRLIVLVLKQLKSFVTAKMSSIRVIIILVKNFGINRSAFRHINVTFVSQNAI